MKYIMNLQTVRKMQLINHCLLCDPMGSNTFRQQFLAAQALQSDICLTEQHLINPFIGNSLDLL